LCVRLSSLSSQEEPNDTTASNTAATGSPATESGLVLSFFRCSLLVGVDSSQSHTEQDLQRRERTGAFYPDGSQRAMSLTNRPSPATSVSEIKSVAPSVPKSGTTALQWLLMNPAQVCISFDSHELTPSVTVTTSYKPRLRKLQFQRLLYQASVVILSIIDQEVSS